MSAEQPRYKVWSIDADGQPSTLLLRTGSTETSDADVELHILDKGMTEVQWVAVAAYERCSRVVQLMLVKNFDTNRWYRTSVTVDTNSTDVHSDVVEVIVEEIDKP